MLGFGGFMFTSAGLVKIYRYLRLSWGNSSGWGANVGLSDVRFYANGVMFPPYMTNNAAPSPYVASSLTYYSDGNDGVTNAQHPFRAFDNDSGTEYVASGNGAGWIQIDLGAGFGISPDRVDVRGRNNNESPASPLILSGSNDGTTFTTLSTFTFGSWNDVFDGPFKSFSTGLPGAVPLRPGTLVTNSTGSSALSTYTVPSEGQVELLLWGGAGGGSAWGTYPGGPGGFTRAVFDVTAGRVIKFAAGQGGQGGGNGNGPSLGGAGANGFGNGGNSGTGTDNYNHGGGGGGASIVWIDDVIKAVAGGGGGNGGEPGYRGGSGGGLTGGNGNNSTTGGTQSGPGGNASGMNGGVGTNTREAGGGGGGGYYGGGGGNGSWTGSSGTGPGGGSGYIAPDRREGVTTAATYTSTLPPETKNPYWANNAGVPTSANTTSYAGRVVVNFIPYIRA